jgi:hypothetical protein
VLAWIWRGPDPARSTQATGSALARPADPAYREGVVVEISDEAAGFVAANGGRLWVWAARPRVCCSGSPAWMRAATAPPQGLAGFTEVPPAPALAGLVVYFRGVGGLRPDVLQIEMHGKRRPGVAAYWDGCLMAMA